MRGRAVSDDSKPKRRVFVRHSGYGCDTGCCGHVVEVEVDGVTTYERFDFSHPERQSKREYAEELVRDELGADHVADLDWTECMVVDD